LITDLVQIKRLGEAARADNERLRQHMKRHNFHERRFRRIAEDFESAIDCQTCANCCRKSTVRLTERDLERLEKALKLKRDRVIADYTLPSEDEGLILRRDEEQGCVFLDGHLCLIYEARPDICRDYPHLVHGPGSLLSRMWHMPERAAVCPIVYNTLESWKDELGFERRV
jgi:Fe-S-cluster containining protein